jgi:large subunit ribosomal protein L1
MAEAKKTTKAKASKKEAEALEVKETKAEEAALEALEEVVEEVQEEVKETETKSTAKAGKRSAKSLKEAEVKQAKEERKLSSDDEPAQVANPVKVTTKVERKSKNYKKAAETIDKTKDYSFDEAIKLAKTTSSVKFDATVEMHVNLGVDPRHADQNVRDNLVLPAGTGRTVKIAVFTEDAAAATKAGADIAGNEEFLAQLEKGQMDFDVLIATPNLMAKLGKYARVLGPRGLMPNPKSGTVTNDVSKAVTEAKGGRIEYRVDSTGIVHLGVGKVSFTEADLKQNIDAVMASLKSNKPSSLKGNYFKAIYLTTSMGPSIRVSLSETN